MSGRDTIIRLPQADGSLVAHQLGDGTSWPRPPVPPASRSVFAAAHVVADPFSDTAPDAPAALDWESTLAFRRHLWSYGLAVAEAMDTAQRGMGLTWPATRELIHRSAAEARACGGRVAAGAGTDHAGTLRTLGDVAGAYAEQLAEVEDAGADVVLMASRQLCAIAAGPDDYRQLYARLLAQTNRPVILHWLGESFDPALAGYWGHSRVRDARDVVLGIVSEHTDAVDGVKVSLLDPEHEIYLRERVPEAVRVYTGDDFNYPELIRGDSRAFSHALLGIFDPIAPIASAALQRLDAGDPDGFSRLLAPTVPLARHLFAAPTRFYKAGVVFLAWLAGHQPGYGMVGGVASARSVVHLAEAFRLADLAGLLPDPALAVARMRAFLTVAGVQ